MGAAMKELADVPAEAVPDEAARIAQRCDLQAQVLDGSVGIATPTREARWTARLGLDALRAGHTGYSMAHGGDKGPEVYRSEDQGLSEQQVQPLLIVEIALDEATWTE